MRPDDLELLIAQYADGSLDPQRAAELEAVLRRDADARAVLASYRAVDAALAGVADQQPVPEVRWDRLASVIGERVSALAAGASLTDVVEERISRLSAGDVSADERAAIDAAAAADPHARLAVTEYAALDRAFEAVRAAPGPDVRWDALAEHLSRAIDRATNINQAAADDGAATANPMRLVQPAAADAQAARAAPAAERPAVLGQIGRFLAQPRRLAVAACLLVAASLSIRLATQGGGPAPVGPSPQTVAPAVGPTVAVTPGQPDGSIVFLPRPGSADGGSTVTSVQIGPPAGVDPAAVSEALGPDIISKPSSAMVVSEKGSVQDKGGKTTTNASDPTALFPR